MGIELRDILGFPLYKAGSDGNVYSFFKGSPRCLKYSLAGSSKDRSRRYKHLFLGVGNPRYIHIIICEAFHGPRPTPQHEASHLDGNSLNCLPDNLRWETTAQNNLRRKEHGTHDLGVKNSRALFDQKQLDQIVAWLKAGIGEVQIGKRMSCNPRTVGKINRGERYRNDSLSYPILPPRGKRGPK